MATPSGKRLTCSAPRGASSEPPIISAATAAEIATTAPTEMSRPRIAITSVMPSDTSISGAARFSTSMSVAAADARRPTRCAGSRDSQSRADQHQHGERRHGPRERMGAQQHERAAAGSSAPASVLARSVRRQRARRSRREARRPCAGRASRARDRERRTTSSISAEMNSTATPPRASATISFMISCRAADVHAARRLIENQHRGLGRQPAREQHLLLVAAGELPDRRFDAGGLDAERLDEALRDRPLLREATGTARSPARACSASTMFSRTERSAIDAFGLALFGAQREPARDRVRGTVERTRPPFTTISPPSAASRPNSSRASSVRPEPSSPARPTISPRRSSRSVG